MNAYVHRPVVSARAFFTRVAPVVAVVTVAASMPHDALARVFSPPASLNSTAASDSEDDGAPFLAFDAKGTAVAVWESLENLENGGGPHDQDIFVARSSDGGVTWSRAASITGTGATSPGIDDNPVVAGDGRGHWVALWQSMGTLGSKLGPDSDIVFARSVDDARTWSRPAPLASCATWDTGQDFNPALLALPDGTWIAAWETSDTIAGKGPDFDIVVVRSTDAGATWSQPLPLNGSAIGDRETDRKVTLATDGHGVVLAAWEAFAAMDGKLGSDWDVLLARSSDSGATWSKPVPLASTAADDGLAADTAVSLAADRQGRWVAVWASSTMAGRGGRENDWDILRVVSTDSGRSWSAPAVLNDSLAGDLERDLAPSIVYDGRGRWVTVWYSKDDQRGTIGTDGDILFSISGDGGRTWTPSTPLVEYASADGRSRDEKPVAATDGNGTVLVAWESDFDPGGKTGKDADIRLVRSLAAAAAPARAEAPAQGRQQAGAASDTAPAATPSAAEPPPAAR